MVDLFSGLGGASAAMRRRGWRVVTVELEADFRPTLVADVRRLPLRGGLRPDLLWASPPCTEFTRSFLPWMRGKYPPPSLELVAATYVAVDWLKPRFWVLENVRGARSFLGVAKQVIGGRYFLWGEFPKIDYWEPYKGMKKERLGPSPDRAALRARIPYGLSRGLAMAIEQCSEIR